MTHKFLGEVLVNEVITTAVKEFTIPGPAPAGEDQPQFAIVWTYHGGKPTADSYTYVFGELLAWSGDGWRAVEDTEAYNPLDPDPNHQIIALFKKD